MAEVFSAGLPHSEICGSRDICSLPQLIAACHVFHRLLVPRHPPCALTCLTICSRPSTVSSRRLSSIALLPRLLFFHELVFCIVWDGSSPIPDVCSSDYSMCSFQGTFLNTYSGGHLLSHTVSSIVPSAARVLTIVFGMGTGVSPARIATRNPSFPWTLDNQTTLTSSLERR